MKIDTHPEYNKVIFLDLQTGKKVLIRSTITKTKETAVMEDGESYQLYKCDVTSDSHPFYTGAKTRIIETGQVEKFRLRFAKLQSRQKP